MGVVAEIDEICASIICDLLPVNTYIGYSGNVFGRIEGELAAYEEMHWDYGLKAVYEEVGEGILVSIENWHSHSVGMTGLVFDARTVVSVNTFRHAQSFKMPARIAKSFGARILHNVLQDRRLVVTLRPDVSFDFDEHGSFLEIETINVSFYNENEETLGAMLKGLHEQKLLIDKQFTISALTGSYQNFHALTGLKKEQFYSGVQESNNFDSLFE